MSAHPATIGWLAAHELRLSWRDWFYLFTAGKKARSRRMGIFFIVGVLLAHAFALFVIGRFTAADFPVSRANYLLLTSGVLLYFFLMTSQAMEAATRVLYARADLELLHSSPVALRRVFVVRLTMIAISIGTMAMLIASPFINVVAWREGAQWLAAYGVVFSTGCVAAALAITLTAFLFNVVGPRRTRFAAQLVAAIVGALFVISLQVIAIFTTDTLSHLAVLRDEWVIALSPPEDSLLWWPARAALGDGVRLAWVLGCAVALAAAAIADFLMALRALHGARRQRRRERFDPPGQGSVVSSDVAGTRLAPQGMDLVAARSLAHVAKPDATALHAATRDIAVEELRPRHGRAGSDHPRAGDGIRAVGRRPGLACHFR